LQEFVIYFHSPTLELFRSPQQELRLLFMLRRGEVPKSHVVQKNLRKERNIYTYIQHARTVSTLKGTARKSSGMKFDECALCAVFDERIFLFGIP
jgi:hypothetical protein